MGKRRKAGHYCWCCGRRRPNERFSGSGHARHLCKACSKLGKQELAFRSAVRNMDRLRPRDRAVVQKIADTHADERVRKYAVDMLEFWRREREEWRAIREAEQREAELWAELSEDPEQIEARVYGAPLLEAQVYEAHPIDVHLLDVELPEADGFEAEVFDEDLWA